MTILSFVASKCQIKDILEMVILKNPDVYLVDANGKNALMHAASANISFQDT